MGFQPPDPGIIADHIRTTISSLEKLLPEVLELPDVQEALRAARAALAEATKADQPSA